MGAQLGCGQLQRVELARAQLDGTQALTHTPGGLAHRLESPQHLDSRGLGWGGLFRRTGAKEESWVGEQTLANLGRAAHEGRAQLRGLAAGKLGLGDRGGQGQAILAATPRDRHQVTHRRVGGDRAAAHQLLDLHRQLADQGQAPRDPADALVDPLGQLRLAQPLAAQGRKQPALLDLRKALRAAQATVQQQGFAGREIPDRHPYRVRAQTFETAQPLEAVDHDMARPLGHHHNRCLLALLTQRSQERPLAIRTLEAQILVAAVELVKLQIHQAPPSGLCGTWQGHRPNHLEGNPIWSFTDLGQSARKCR